MRWRKHGSEFSLVGGGLYSEQNEDMFLRMFFCFFFWCLILYIELFLNLLLYILTLNLILKCYLFSKELGMVGLGSFASRLIWIWMPLQPCKKMGFILAPSWLYSLSWPESDSQSLGSWSRGIHSQEAGPARQKLVTTIFFLFCLEPQSMERIATFRVDVSQAN